MKITPLEIRQRTFEKGFRGYDKDDVNAFMLSLSQEWERLLDENKGLRMKLEQADREVSQLREVESSLFKTLKTAEDTGAKTIEQANRQADLQLRETQMKTERMVEDAQAQAKGVVDRAEMNARETLQSMYNELKAMEQAYRMLESYHDNLVSDLRSLANDTLERMDKFERKKLPIDPTAMLQQAKSLLNKELLNVRNEQASKVSQLEEQTATTRQQLPPPPKAQEPAPAEPSPTAAPAKQEAPAAPEEPAPEAKQKAKAKKKEKGSTNFFDELE